LSEICILVLASFGVFTFHILLNVYILNGNGYNTLLLFANGV